MPPTRFRTSRASTASSSVLPPEKRPVIFGGHQYVDVLRPEPFLERYHLLAIDPGLQGTGVAFFGRGGILQDGGVLKLPGSTRDLDWMMRTFLMVELLRPWAERAEVIISEMMEYQGAGVRGVGWRSGDMQRTTYFIGAMSQLRNFGLVKHFGTVPVHRWKGQLPKHLVQERLEARYGRETCRQMGLKEHAWDAAGIGSWALGKF